AGARNRLCAEGSRDRLLRHLYGARAASAPSVESRTPAQERIDRVLRDLVQPSDYVKWEYFSRQRLLARGIVGSRQAQRTRVLDIGCGHGALSLTLAESAGPDVVEMDVLESGVRSVAARNATRARAAAARASGHPDRHRREGFTERELGRLGAQVGLRMAVAYTYRIPIPDRVMQVTPRALSRSVATLGTRPLPLGLQLYAEFTKN